jgi:hypothetical protein
MVGVALVPVVAMASRGLTAPLWADEVTTLRIARNSLVDLPAYLVMDGSPPAYYAILHVWTGAFGTSPAAVHLLSVLAALLSVVAAGWAGLVWGGRGASMLAASLAGASPLLLYYSTEGRMYSLVLLLAFLGIGLAEGALRESPRALLGLSTVVGGLLLTHHWAWFFVAGGAVALIGLVRREPAYSGAVRRIAFWCAVTALVTTVPWLGVTLRQVLHTGAPWSKPVAVWTVLLDVIRSSGGFPIVIAVAVVALLTSDRWGTKPRAAHATASFAPVRFLATWLVAALAVSTTAVLLGAGYSVRYTAVLAPLAIAVLACVARETNVRLGIVLVAALVLSGVVVAARTPLAKGNAHEVGARLRDRLRTGDAVIVAAPEQVAAIAFYAGDDFDYFDLMGRVADTTATDWTDISDRIRRTSPTDVLKQLERPGPDRGVALVVPRVELASSSWVRAVSEAATRLELALAADRPVLARRLEPGGAYEDLEMSVFGPAREPRRSIGR